MGAYFDFLDVFLRLAAILFIYIHASKPYGTILTHLFHLFSCPVRPTLLAYFSLYSFSSAPPHGCLVYGIDIGPGRL